MLFYHLTYLLQAENLPVSFSDHSDIVTLGDLKDDDHAEVAEEAAANEFYLGTSSSSQYAFIAADTGILQNLIHYHNVEKVSTPVQNTSPLPVCQSRFVVELLETSTESGELKPSSEKSAHRRPLFSRWPY